MTILEEQVQENTALFKSNVKLNATIWTFFENKLYIVGITKVQIFDRKSIHC